MPDRLSSDEYNIYKHDVFASVGFDKKKSSLTSRAYILAGQPGSGKSFLRKAITEFFSQENEDYITIDPDDFRELHPRFPDYNEEDDTETAARTHPDASQVAHELLEAAISGKLNIIIDGTLKDSEKALDLVEKLKRAGYEIHIKAMCVPPQISWDSCIVRYNDQKRKTGYGRWVPQEIHDQAVNSMVLSILKTQEQGIADSISIFARKEPSAKTNPPLSESYPSQESETEKRLSIRQTKEVYINYGERELPLK